ncbi:serine protease 40-like [Psammomys obesus]|uniref:serine protease 40-like n=1 Tax=Psammomys obesus TaxID=48139 RepID=UPI0024529647|nr:serine protease 40-like [Psammomys obesus]
MWGARAQKLGPGRGGAYLLATLLFCFSLLSLSTENRTTTKRPIIKLDGKSIREHQKIKLEALFCGPDNHPTPPSPSKRCLAAAIVSTVCGKSKFQGKIFGGQNTGCERWPWQASLLFRGRHICGAVLIDKNWLVSAAHCLQRSRKPSDYRILLGYSKLSSPSNFSLQMTVNLFILHENYSKLYFQGSDIVLIQLHKKVEYNSHVSPVCVPNSTLKVPANKACWISGWGMLREDKFLKFPYPLQAAEVFLMADSECEAFFQTPEITTLQYKAIRDDMICAGDLTNEKSICRGDSGGPLVCSLEDAWYVIGLASWTAACLEPISSPNIFTKVSYFSNWIRKKQEDTPDADPFSAPPQESASALAGWKIQDAATTIKYRTCTTLLPSQVFLLRWIWLRVL